MIAPYPAKTWFVKPVGGNDYLRAGLCHSQKIAAIRCILLLAINLTSSQFTHLSSNTTIEMLLLWTFAVVALRFALASSAEVGAFEALYFFSAYDYGVEVGGAAKNRIASDAHNGDKAYGIQQFLKFIAPTRKFLERDEDGKQIPGKWTELPRWDKVDWDIVEKNPDDLEKIAYELINSNFTANNVNVEKIDVGKTFSDEKTLTNQLAIIVATIHSNFEDEIDELAKKKFGRVNTVLQAVGDAHRKAAADGLRNSLQEYFKSKGKDYKIFTKPADKAPVRNSQEIDMEKTIKESGDGKAVTGAISDWRRNSIANDGGDEAMKGLRRRLNGADNLQRARQSLIKRPKRACTG
ncbi:hypothetical protein PWT90_05833 [Aphanocladium album]|nr:hypothetical protein PWT90_05833 [Aphanocladium album]